MIKKLIFILAMIVLMAGFVCAEGNYFGNGLDGDVVISSNTQLTVQNKNGAYDGDMVVMNYNSLTINSGVTLTTDQPCRGMLIYVKGDAVINGELSMTARGAYANPAVAGASDNSIVSATGLRYPVFKYGETETLGAVDFAGTGNIAVAAVANQLGISGEGKIFTIVRTGADGGAKPSSYNGNAGLSGSSGQSGGGGSGSAWDAAGGAGSAGTVFSGGTGGGNGNCLHYGRAGTSYGGAGGVGGCGNGCGAGNPSDGTGGLLILVVGGDLTIGSTGVISANGKKGGDGGKGGGGGSGGGNILVLYAGFLSNFGTTQTSGGGGGEGYGYIGGNGGTGSVQGPTQIDGPQPNLLGIVKDSSGIPIENAIVAIFNQDKLNQTTGSFRGYYTTTNSTGGWSYGVPPGTYLIVAYDPNNSSREGSMKPFIVVP